MLAETEEVTVEQIAALFLQLVLGRCLGGEQDGLPSLADLGIFLVQNRAAVLQSRSNGRLLPRADACRFTQLTQRLPSTLVRPWVDGGGAPDATQVRIDVQRFDTAPGDQVLIPFLTNADTAAMLTEPWSETAL